MLSPVPINWILIKVEFIQKGAIESVFPVKLFSVNKSLFQTFIFSRIVQASKQ